MNYLNYLAEVTIEQWTGYFTEKELERLDKEENVDRFLEDKKIPNKVKKAFKLDIEISRLENYIYKEIFEPRQY